MLCFFYGGQSGVEARMIHLLVMVATGRERHMSSLVAAWDFFIVLWLVVADVPFLPVLTRSLLPRAFRVMRWGLLPTSMLGLDGESRSF
jgi:hypothetical protein